MTRRSLVLVAALALTILPSLATAQHSYGDGFGIGGVLLPSGSPTLLGTTRIGESLGVEFALGLRVFDDGDSPQTALGASFGIKKYLTDRKQFQPFFGGRFGFRHYSGDNGRFGEKSTMFGVTAVLGGEYFITRRLSFEGELGFDLYFGSIEIGTGSRLAAIFYL
jgi:hypothetical protein